MPDKQLEAEYLERLKRARPDLHLAGAEHGDAPDFLIPQAAGILGLEVTRYSPPRADVGFVAEEQDSLRDRVLGLAQQFYIAGGGVPLHLQVIFNDHCPVRSHRTRELAHEVASLLLAKSISVMVYANVPLVFGERNGFMAEIDEITAVGVPEPEYAGWHSSHAGWVRTADWSDFEGILALKEPRLGAYRLKAPELWLLTVFEFLPGGVQVQLPREITFSLTTGFDRVFALERVSGFCVEIPVVKPRHRVTPNER